ncbi:unnamed protein product [Caenorhabditis bovis]|uniref:Major facilitator superfamily (MFS) profile domain-containing protein n=1 Tax=Caenorhabditis bovis TaxID=2654633 RepID=A0A8S1EJC8_9PELO|nr:unnamed protein product [Caenorhabditis bovis]
MVGRTLKKSASAISDTVRRTFSTKTWEHKEQLHTLTEENKFFLKKVRWQIAIMAHIGFAISFGIRSNFGVAKNRMINNFTDAYGYIHEKEFFWTATEVGMMESSFFYGYAASQIPAGVLAAKYAPNRIFLTGVIVAAALNIATAFALRFHPTTDFVVMFIQSVQGLALGVTYPAMHGVWKHWAPPLERSKLATTTFTGSAVGVMVGLPTGAFLVSHIHWSAPFYAFGAAGVIWALMWVYVAGGSPKTHSYISNDERTYITEKIGEVTVQNMTLTTLPWKNMLTSTAVWAIIICTFCRSWSFFLLLGNQLTYMKDVLHIDITNSGIIAIFPQLCTTIVTLASGQLADYIRASGKMTTEGVRKMFNTIGFTIEAVMLGSLAFVRNPIIAIACLITACAGAGAAQSGFNVNHFDIAPRYASILMGIANGLGACAGAGGLITNTLTINNPDGWKWVFILATSVDAFGIIFYLLFAKGEVLEWAREPEKEETFNEFVRRMSTIVRRLSRRTRASEDSYSRMEDEAKNSSEMIACTPPPTQETNIAGLCIVPEEPETNRVAEKSLKTDRPEV